MDQAQREAKLRELEELRSRMLQLEKEVVESPVGWQASGWYGSYYATTGFMLGIFGAAASLLLNIIGSLVVGQHPLRIIQVYLTFPLGERALSPEMDTGMVLAVGCCLYLATGMLLGILFQVAFSRLVPQGKLASRLGLATVLALALWVINFYGILSWLQPLLFGGDWIVELIPWWVGASTHLVFGWTMALVYPLGAYTPYRLQTEK